jgi:hypothetical protein
MANKEEKGWFAEAQKWTQHAIKKIKLIVLMEISRKNQVV